MHRLIGRRRRTCVAARKVSAATAESRRRRRIETATTTRAQLAACRAPIIEGAIKIIAITIITHSPTQTLAQSHSKAIDLMGLARCGGGSPMINWRRRRRQLIGARWPDDRCLCTGASPFGCGHVFAPIGGGGDCCGGGGDGAQWPPLRPLCPPRAKCHSITRAADLIISLWLWRGAKALPKGLRSADGQVASERRARLVFAPIQICALIKLRRPSANERKAQSAKCDAKRKL